MIKRLLDLASSVLPGRGLASRRSSLDYIPARQTVTAARKAGMSVCDYVETLWNQQGETRKVIENMARCGALAHPKPHIVEIGAGTGRYLEQVLTKCTPGRYESYETAKDWAEWLALTYGVVSHEADGVSLRQTPEAAADLVHAHGVFVYLPFLVSCRYWKEIWRVTKPGGFVVLDVITEECLDPPALDGWVASGLTYPVLTSANFITTLYTRNGFDLVTTFMNKYGAGTSQYLVFQANHRPVP